MGGAAEAAECAERHSVLLKEGSPRYPSPPPPLRIMQLTSRPAVHAGHLRARAADACGDRRAVEGLFDEAQEGESRHGAGQPADTRRGSGHGTRTPTPRRRVGRLILSLGRNRPQPRREEVTDDSGEASPFRSSEWVSGSRLAWHGVVVEPRMTTRGGTAMLLEGKNCIIYGGGGGIGSGGADVRARGSAALPRRAHTRAAPGGRGRAERCGRDRDSGCARRPGGRPARSCRGGEGAASTSPSTSSPAPTSRGSRSSR